MKKLSGLKKLTLPLAASFIFNSGLQAPKLKKYEPIYKLEEGKYIVDEELTKKKYSYIEIAKLFSKDVENIEYVLDSKTYGKNKNYWQNPDETIKRGKGNCSDKAIFLNDTLEKILPDVYLVYGQRKEEDPYSHVWQEFVIGQDTFIIESSKKVTIYNKRKLLDLDNGYLYKPHTDSAYRNYALKKIKGYEKRNGKTLNFRQFSNH